MPTCIYCRSDKPDSAFDPEHVFSRGLCGPGANWTLTREVCKKCNARFSAFEAHWMRQAIEATARNFHGLEGRSEKQRFDRVQPVEIDDCYIVNKGDSTVYEAGFAFPADHHYRPQIVQLQSGLQCIASSHEDEKALRAALDNLPWHSMAVTVPQWRKRHSDWLIAEIEPRPRKGYCITDFKREAKPRGFWMRDFPHVGLMKKNDVLDTDRVLTTRMALDHRRRFYFRAANIEALPPFLNNLILNRFSFEKKPQPEEREQALVFGLALDLVKIYQSVLKNGFNLFTYFYGSEPALHPNFDDLRRMLIEEPTDRKFVMQRCKMYDGETIDFPKSGNPKEHRLQLNLSSRGLVHFRMRLFDSLGYHAILGQIPEALNGSFQTKRVAVDYLGVGISELATWP